jgi:hypothetical protein
MERRFGYPFVSRAILAFFAALLLIAWASIARSAPDPCWERHTLSIRFDTLGVTGARRLKDDELKAAARWVNSQEPVTDIEWQTIILAELPDGSGLILIGREEAVCTRMHVPPAAWLRVKLAMLGIPV